MGKVVGDAKLDNENDVYNDLDTLEESIRKKVKESEKDIVTIDNVYTDEEGIGELSS